MQKNEKYHAVQLTNAGQYVENATIELSPDVLLLDGSGEIHFSGAPFRLQFLVVCFCTSGEGLFSVDEKEVQLKKGDLYICVGDPVTTPISLSPDFRVKAALTTPQCLRDNVIGLHQLWPFLHDLYLRPVITMSREEQEKLTETFDFIFKHRRFISGSYATDYQNTLIRLLYFDICSIARNHFIDHSSRQYNGHRLFDQFVKLSETHSVVERQVCWYADQLGVTAKYLTEMVKQVSGRTASEWIRSFAIANIKKMLIGTDMSAKEIATTMHFSSQSMFTKFFSNATGYSPSAFRAMVRKQNKQCKGNDRCTVG